MNYSKFSGQFVCKMAMMFAFMFAACSEMDSGNNVAGGTVEETGVYALAGLASDVYPQLLELQVEGNTPTDASLNNDKFLKATEGAVVVVYELDSLTLDATGRFLVDTLDNADGQFAFEKIDFNSPYVFVDVQDSCVGDDCYKRISGFWADSVLTGKKYQIPLSAIIDMRKYSKISVNSLSDMKVPLVKKYFAEGLSFDSACKKAELDVLDSFGVYEDLGDFENLESVNGELSYVLRVMHFAVDRMSILDNYFLNIVERLYGVTPAAVAGFGETAVQIYDNTMKFIDYQIGYFARNAGVGQCTESRENENHALKGFENFSIVCHSNKWKPGWKTVEYVNGTMVDNRDGKMYKTVTYNWGDVSQTWMAENLNYADTTSSNADSALKNNLLKGTNCLDMDPSCEVLSRYYTWKAAMNLGWSDIDLTDIVRNEIYDAAKDEYIETYDTVIVEDRCKIADLDELYRTNSGEVIEFCSLKSTTGECLALDTIEYLYRYCEERYGLSRLDISRLVPESKPVIYQGVCPDGWRLPNKNDWAILQENMHAQGASLTDAYGSGFGYSDAMVVYGYNPYTSSIVIQERSYARFVAVPERDNGSYSNFFNWLAYEKYKRETAIAESSSNDESLPWNYDRYLEYGDVYTGFFFEEAPVRCIKN